MADESFHIASMDDRFTELNPKTKTCVVLGVRGFIGKSLVLRLLKLGNWIVRVADSTHSLQIHTSESLLADALSSSRASYFHLDVTDKHRIAKVLEGSSIVFYIDVDGISYDNDFYSCYKLIVQGTSTLPFFALIGNCIGFIFSITQFDG